MEVSIATYVNKKEIRCYILSHFYALKSPFWPPGAAPSSHFTTKLDFTLKIKIEKSLKSFLWLFCKLEIKLLMQIVPNV